MIIPKNNYLFFKFKEESSDNLIINRPFKNNIGIVTYSSSSEYRSGDEIIINLEKIEKIKIKNVEMNLIKTNDIYGVLKSDE